MAELTELHETHRVLDRGFTTSLASYVSGGGGRALQEARGMSPGEVIDLITASGLRGRGGGGFPTGTKWRTVAESHSGRTTTTVVVNAAEGEPGTFKDRAILRHNPYRMLEGAAIAAHAVGASRIRIGIKASFVREIRLVDKAIGELESDGWLTGIDTEMVLGAGYLFGEETAMLEVIEGRQPFPRVTPPFRRGIDDDDPTRSAADIDLATIGGSTEPPALINNVETLSNVPLIIDNGAEWFKSVGTDESPGTIVVTITGDTNRGGVAEVPMGTRLGDAIDLIGWGMKGNHQTRVIMSGTANPMMPVDALDTPLSYEGMRAAGYGLGSAGFVVFDERNDPSAVARGISRFLAVESCGQCEACKLDGTELSVLLDRLARSKASAADIVEIRKRKSTVSIGARCNLARQQEAVVGSLLSAFADDVSSHEIHGTSADLPPSQRIPLVAPIEDIVGGNVILDPNQSMKNLDWSYGEIDSGASPAARLGNTPFLIKVPLTSGRHEQWSATPENRIHPLEEIDEAHNELDYMLHDLMHRGGPSKADALDAFTHSVRVHIDVTQRILYPTLRRHCGSQGDELADKALETEDQINRIVGSLSSEMIDQARTDGDLRTVGRLLQRHAADEAAMFSLLRHTLDEQEKKVLLDALAEAASSSLI